MLKYHRLTFILKDAQVFKTSGHAGVSGTRRVVSLALVQAHGICADPVPECLSAWNCRTLSPAPLSLSLCLLRRAAAHTGPRGVGSRVSCTLAPGVSGCGWRQPGQRRPGLGARRWGRRPGAGCGQLARSALGGPGAAGRSRWRPVRVLVRVYPAARW